MKNKEHSNKKAWGINPDDFPKSGSAADKLVFLCRFGLLAPSVHNTQPWSFVVEPPETIRIIINQKSKLEHGDATGRQLWISLGCCIETISRVAYAYGYEVSDHIDYVQQVTTLTVRHNPRLKTNLTLTKAILERRSNRNIYLKKAIPSRHLRTLRAIATPKETRVIITTDQKVIQLVADLTKRGIGIALSIPAFKKELSHLIKTNWHDGPIGMPGEVLLYKGLDAATASAKFRWLQVADGEANKEYKRAVSAAALALVFTKGDTAKYWTAAGRAYQSIGFEATQIGLDQATMASAVEAPDFHKDIEAALGTSYRLQTIMRLGYSPHLVPHSPRFNADEAITLIS